MVGQNLMAGHVLLGGRSDQKLSCNDIGYIFVIILMHLVLKFWLWGRFVAEKQTYVMNLMAGHLLSMTYNENGK